MICLARSELATGIRLRPVRPLRPTRLLRSEIRPVQFGFDFLSRFINNGAVGHSMCGLSWVMSAPHAPTSHSLTKAMVMERNSQLVKGCHDEKTFSLSLERCSDVGLILFCAKW